MYIYLYMYACIQTDNEGTQTRNKMNKQMGKFHSQLIAKIESNEKKKIPNKRG